MLVAFSEMSDEQLQSIRNTIVVWLFLGGLLAIVGLLLPEAHWALVVLRYALIVCGFFIAVPPIFQLNGIEQELARRNSQREPLEQPQNRFPATNSREPKTEL